ncbi:MAG: DUF402 domain-containing protein [Chloroflexota bacterium]
MFLQPGDHAVHRGVYKDKVWIARPVTIVKDGPELTKLLIRPGSICKFTTGLRTRKYPTDENEPVLSRWAEQQSLNWSFYDHVWRKKRVLMICRPDNFYSLHLHWDDETDDFLYWYINFELPTVRSGVCFDTLDLELDLIVYPDFSIAWKDSDEFHQGIACGVITKAQVDQIEAAKENILNDIQDQRNLFNDKDLIRWAPAEAWKIPQLPEDWNMVE